jgi:hypothetical protein
MIDFSRARRLSLALIFLSFPLGLHAQSVTTVCGGSVNAINMIAGRHASRSIACYATYSGMNTLLASTMSVYLPSEPQTGSYTLPASSIGVSTDGATFTTFTGTGSGSPITVFNGVTPPSSSAPLTIYVQLTIPGCQKSGQYTGMLMVSTSVTHNP